jgi:hypothetical protein
MSDSFQSIGSIAARLVDRLKPVTYAVPLDPSLANVLARYALEQGQEARDDHCRSNAGLFGGRCMNMSSTYLYVIGRHQGPVKIGISRDPSARLGSLQTGCPFKLDLLHKAALPSRVDAERLSRWFRFYDDAINDPKILKLSDKLHRVWVGMLCIASKNNGELPTLSDMALMIRMKPEKLYASLKNLEDAGLIDDGWGDSPLRTIGAVGNTNQTFQQSE